MILKASQRSGGQDLAAHLMRADENEHVRLHELRGFVSEDLKGAFKEADAISRGTKCRQYLFSLSLSPPEQARSGWGWKASPERLSSTKRKADAMRIACGAASTPTR
jgi:hypothetical protein